MPAQTSIDPKDPRLRPFRVAAHGVYLVVVVAFCLLIIMSVYRAMRAMTPPRRPPAEETLAVKECVEIARNLFRELDDQRKGLSEKAPAAHSDRAWTRFRVDWLERLRLAESRCAVEGRSRPELNDVFDRLDRLMSLHTIHAVQYAGEIGPSVDRLHQALEAAQGK